MNTSSKRFPIVLSAAISLAVVLWMVSGVFSNSESSTPDETATTPASTRAQQVRIQQLQATEITREIIISGRTEPNRMIEVRSEAEGTVKQLGSARGEPVASGTTIAKLDMRDRIAQLNEAQALVAQRDLELRGVENLHAQRFTTEVQVAEAKARLESARAGVEHIELEIRDTTIAAPFDAILQERDIEIGDFVRVGDVVAELVDLDPLLIVGEINEREVSEMAVGSKGIAVLVDGTRLEGEVRYLAPNADAGTRTFKVELAVPNPDNVIRAGLTAELRLFADKIRVHNISAALLTLADDGTIGAKVVDNTDTVQFYPVEIVGNSDDGMQVTGLPDSVRLITVGQGFVTVGQKVDAVASIARDGGAVQ
jgi:membrane fusion protein, multidrug efflux system